MTNQESVLALFAQANPIPDPEAFADFSRASASRETIEVPRSAEGSLHETIPGSGEYRNVRSRRGLLVASVAAVLILIVGAGANWAIRTNVIGGAGDPTSTFDGVACTYEGPTEFDLGSEVTFTFVNETDIENMIYAVVHVPDGTTVQQIYDDGVFVAGTNRDRDAKAYDRDVAAHSEAQITAVLDATGLYALNCVDTDRDTGHDYASLISVPEE